MASRVSAESLLGKYLGYSMYVFFDLIYHTSTAILTFMGRVLIQQKSGWIMLEKRLLSTGRNDFKHIFR